MGRGPWGRATAPSRESMIDPSPPVREINRLVLSVSIANDWNDWFALVQRAGQLLMAVAIALFYFRDAQNRLCGDTVQHSSS